MTPLRALRARCLDCAGTSTKVDRCGAHDCPLYLLRSGHGSKAVGGGVMRPIRHYCLWCCVGSSNEVKLCPAKACPLQDYRSGHRPKTEIDSAVTEATARGHSAFSQRSSE